MKARPKALPMRTSSAANTTGPLASSNLRRTQPGALATLGRRCRSTPPSRRLEAEHLATSGADWLEACGASGAFVVVVGLYYRDFRDRRRAQARGVCAWVVGRNR
jgi:hypothetical protein